MRWRRLLGPLATFSLTFTPMYSVERLANYFFLSRDPVFYAISGSRMDLFVAIALVGSVVAGAILLDLKTVVITQAFALVAFFSLVYILCDPRVCYSVGPDGLEPLRMGFFLGSITVVGASIGIGARGRLAMSAIATIVVAFSIFVALSFYPVVYAFAGAKLLPPLSPWNLLIFLALLSYVTAVTSCLRVGQIPGFLTPVAATGFVFALSWTLSAAYITQVLLGVQMMALGALAGSTLGLITVRFRKSFVEMHKAVFSNLVFVALFLVLLMTVIIVPDEVSGVLPQPTTGGALRLVIGSPVYAGGYMDAEAGHSTGVAVTVSFAGTTPASIGDGNFLSAGVGVHSPDCCRDGIDYGYRFDVYQSHSGNDSLVASAWQICDNNAACGGHSWKNLLFSKIGPLRGQLNMSSVTLQMQWEGHAVSWTYRVGSGGLNGFALFSAPAQQDAGFNTGVLSGQFYFFQFGMMSRVPLSNPGWSVTFTCPSVFIAGRWQCVSQARTMQGGESYWKVLWRWGEDYPNVVATRSGSRSFTLSYSKSSTMKSFQTLW